jgi:hypothetical protein
MWSEDTSSNSLRDFLFSLGLSRTMDSAELQDGTCHPRWDVLYSVKKTQDPVTTGSETRDGRGRAQRSAHVYPVSHVDTLLLQRLFLSHSEDPKSPYSRLTIEEISPLIFRSENRKSRRELDDVKKTQDPVTTGSETRDGRGRAQHYGLRGTSGRYLPSSMGRPLFRCRLLPTCSRDY